MTQSRVLRVPVAKDGIALHRLIAQCPPLDPNSVYCNLLHCSHFASTSVAAEADGELVGFVSGYRVPERDDTLFIWQVAVAEQARGQKLASKMLSHLLKRDICQQLRYVETTITADNRASWALFEHLARELNTELNHSIVFDRDKHFAGEHDSESLLRLGPFKLNQ